VPETDRSAAETAARLGLRAEYSPEESWSSALQSVPNNARRDEVLEALRRPVSLTGNWFVGTPAEGGLEFRLVDVFLPDENVSLLVELGYRDAAALNGAVDRLRTGLAEAVRMRQMLAFLESFRELGVEARVRTDVLTVTVTENPENE